MANKIQWSNLAPESDYGDRTSWKGVEPGDLVVGTLASAKPVTTRYGDKVVVELDDVTAIVMDGNEQTPGPVEIWANVSLLGGMSDVDAQPGDVLKIVFDSYKDTGRGNALKVYDVEKLEG